MINTPLISVIVPCYKVEQYLSKCIDSILRQTYCNLEIWLVDDGSPDNCGGICEEYAAKDNRIKVIHKENGGLSDARNVAIDKATGEWITFVDSDDYVTEDYVDALYNLVEKYQCKASVTQHYYLYENGKVTRSHFDTDERALDAVSAVKTMFYQERCDTMAWGKLYHRSLFQKGIRYPKGLLFEDLCTTYRLLLGCDCVAFGEARTYYYLIRSYSIERSYNLKKIEDAKCIMKMMQNDDGIVDELINPLKCRLFCFAFHVLLPVKEDKELIEYIKNHRRLILCDKKARKKARVVALLSYTHIKVIKCLFQMVDYLLKLRM